MSSTETITRGSSFGAFKYNLNQKLGWAFGDPTNEELVLYSDVFYDGQNALNDILGDDTTKFLQYDKSHPDQTFVNLVSSILTYDNTPRLLHFDKETYDTKFGHSFFPWNVIGLQRSDGLYCVKRYASRGIVAVNPMRWECLTIKAITLLKLFILIYGGYLTTKWGLKYTRKK